MEKKCTQEFKIKVPWGHVAAKAWGNSNNFPILMVHGILDNAGAFDRLIMQLPKKFYYVCIDLPGHGWSSHFPPGILLSYFNYVQAIKYVLDELKWDQLYYVGHSFGAHLGVFFTIVFPGRIERLVLIDSFIPLPLANQDIIPLIKTYHDLTIEALNVKSVRQYTKEEIMFGLMNMRKCSLKSEAAKALFERSVTNVGNDSYIYNRDYRLKFHLSPLLDLSQSSYILKSLKVKTLLLLATATTPQLKCNIPKLVATLDTLKNLNIIEVVGNHDVHNNYPEHISLHITQFLTQSSKL